MSMAMPRAFIPFVLTHPYVWFLVGNTLGAGAGGASTAYYLNSFLEQPPSTRRVDHSITVFEQSDKIGGRCAVFKVRDQGQQQDKFVEMGASIFVQVNQHLVDAAKEFGLKTKPLDDELVAIWDGKQFVYEQSQWKYWSMLKGLRRWILAPIKVQIAKVIVNHCLLAELSIGLP